MRVVKAGVVGAGTMGASIAELLAFNGIEVLLKDQDTELVDRALHRIGEILGELVEFHAGRADRELARLAELGLELTSEQEAKLRQRLAPKIGPQRAEQTKARVHGVTDYSAFAEVDLVVEAVFEREEVKRPVLQELDRVIPEHAVLATNTSSLSVTALARGLRHARQMLAMHFFNPPYTLPLVELAAGIETREELLTEVGQWLGGLRNHRYPMVPVVVKESPGFVVNRLLIPVLTEAGFALDEGLAGARDIDLAMKSGAGFPMGPFELADLIGLDVALAVAETLGRDTGDPKYRPPQVLRRLVAAGHLGRKTGRGFYEYA